MSIWLRIYTLIMFTPLWLLLNQLSSIFSKMISCSWTSWHIPTSCIVTFLQVCQSLMSKILRFAEELGLLCELKVPLHFTFHDPLDHSALCTSHDVLTCTLDMNVENLSKPIINFSHGKKRKRG